MKQGSVAAGVTAVLISLFASAAWTSGVDQPPRTVGQLATWCRDGLQPWMPRHEPSAVEAARGAYCFAYVQAMIDSQLNAPGDPYCFPAGASHREVIEGFVMYAARAPREVQEADVGAGVDTVLQSAFSCIKTGA
ncbi:Rap1a/Tai family immunity protein [Luteimonas fraxinea]|uniref:Rap1a/Tai family immunity protein n=1 Tax=Luteimonas fraxinea TaxID=2901869 RepID=UPI001E33464F|nr:Rap1a/Tai family immunity protein [Luteimonas fraxinea]MCD9126690.1 hypothetical protein [Luteimonas fraxinea]